VIAGLAPHATQPGDLREQWGREHRRGVGSWLTAGQEMVDGNNKACDQQPAGGSALTCRAA
jgi:hypothetical protein